MSVTAALPEPGPSRDAAWQVAGMTALGYAVVGWLALVLAVPPSYASPLYPSAGIALAAVLTYGRAALPGVAIGAFAVNVLLSASRGQLHAAAFVMPAVIGVGAMLQAGAGVWLLRRFVPQPMVLGAPREIALSGLLGAVVACLVSPTVATTALLAGGAIPTDQIAASWGTWWVGDTLGVLIGAPLVLTIIGRPRADWVPRRRTVGAPLLLAILLLGAGTLVIGRWDEDRAVAAFEHDAAQLAADARSRLADPLHALEALNSAYLAAGGLDDGSLKRAARWWLSQPLELQGMGFSPRVARTAIPAFEAAAHGDGAAGYHVFDRDPALSQGDADVVALRYIEPAASNAGALGVNTLGVNGARAAVLLARDSGGPASSAGFRLTQSTDNEPGFVVYQAVYDGQPATQAERRQRFRGVLFVAVRAERLLSGLAGGSRAYLRWCLIDRGPAPIRVRLAGPVGCEDEAAAAFERRHAIDFASRPLELRVGAAAHSVPYLEQANAWPFSVAGMLAAAMLGALLLSETARSRRIELAVADRTAELRREVHERSQAEHALGESEARLRGILDNVPIGVMFIDTSGRIVEINPHLAQMLGHPVDWLRRSSLAEITHGAEQAENTRQLASLVSGEVAISRRQMRLLRVDGEVLWVRVHLSVLREGDGPPTRLAGVVEDITEHLRLEESERARDRAEAASLAKSEFVSRMSHELRTPLNAMIGFAQLLGLDRNPALLAHQREWTTQIQRAGWHLLEMINDTLDLARIESGAIQLTPRPLDVPTMIAASSALVATAAGHRGVTLRTELKPEADTVLADETRLKQVLTNLLSNAVKYNRDGGSVLVSAGVGTDGAVEIAVRDSGMGMTPEQQAALFQPYNRLGRESTAIEGTGIGLVISRKLAELMGGSLEATSVFGQGSTFVLRLPHADPTRTPQAPARPIEQLPYHRRLVHYVEDNETNIEVMRGILAQRPQIELEVSTVGLDGLTAIRRRRPDLILLDMQLPDISGLELLRHLMQDDDAATIPVIVVSADATAARMQEALTLGAAYYLTKPVEVSRFLETVDELLEPLETRWSL